MNGQSCDIYGVLKCTVKKCTEEHERKFYIFKIATSFL